MPKEDEAPKEKEEEKDKPKVCGQKCEVYSRVCGYLRPVQNWNKGKKQEFLQRKAYKKPGERMVSPYVMDSDQPKACEQDSCAVQKIQLHNPSITAVDLMTPEE